MKSRAQPNARLSIRRHTAVGLAAAIFLVGGLGGWAVVTELSGAVVAPGTVVVDSHVKKVQHPTGGVVGEILARDGDRVRAGDIVIRLDETVAKANLAMVAKSLDELATRQARLEAERDGLKGVIFPPSLHDRRAEPELARLVQSEERLFENRREARVGQKSQLKERIAQLQEQIEGTNLQAGAKADEIKLIQDELVGVQELWKKNLVPITRVTALKREETRLRGERGQLISTVAQARGRISETALQILQIDQDLRSEVSKELREVQAKIGGARRAQGRGAGPAQAHRHPCAPGRGRAPIRRPHRRRRDHGGRSPDADHARGDDLSIEVKVSPQDIDQLQTGLDTVLRLSAFNQRTTPELKGKVSRIAADLVVDQRTGAATLSGPHRVRARENASAWERARLMPGMPVESFIQTGYRTVFSYLTKPLADNIERAFREE